MECNIYKITKTKLFHFFSGRKINTVNHHCNAWTFYGFGHFHLHNLDGFYREHMFLKHHLVPHKIRNPQIPTINITNIIQNETHVNENDIKKIINAFSQFKSFPVINLCSLERVTLSISKTYFKDNQNMYTLLENIKRVAY